MFHDSQHHQRFEEYISATEIDKNTIRDLLFSAPFHHHNHSAFEDKRRMNWKRPSQQCLGTRPLKICSPLPVQRKKYFSPLVITVVAGFKNNSKDRHIFSEFKHGICDKMKNKKNMRKRVVKEARFPFSFFYFSSQAKTHA